MSFRLDVMAREVRAGLAARPRSIPSKYFYDEHGSHLFDRICELPEYYLTRAEHALLARHADEIAELTRAEALLEIGSGMARKTGLLLAALGGAVYVPFDISPEAIAASARELAAAHPRLRVHGVIGDFAHDLPRLIEAAPGGPRLFAFLGSTLGNLDERAAPAFVRALARLMRAGDWLLLGIDLVKDARVLDAAYNDTAGVTAAFNRNILRVLARDLDADFDARAFEHVARYVPERERVEMHLVATRAQRARFGALGTRVEFGTGERVLTEISRKFTRGTIARTLAAARLHVERWLASEQFALALARPY